MSGLFGIFDTESRSSTSSNTTNNNYDQKQTADLSGSSGTAYIGNASSGNVVNSSDVIAKQADLAATINGQNVALSKYTIGASSDLIEGAVDRVASFSTNALQNAQQSAAGIVSTAQTEAAAVLNQAQNPSGANNQQQLVIVIVGVIFTALFTMGGKNAHPL